MWNIGMENFSSSFREAEGEEEYDDDDDEESLKWAAIERLPTFDRIRTSVLVEDDGGGSRPREVDVKHLGMLEKKAVLDRLVKFAEQDNEKFLLKLKNRIARVGIDLPTVEVRFENLSVEGEAYVGSRALPTLFNFVANLFEGFLSHLHLLPKRKKAFPILHGLTGIIKPGRITLLVGPPNSGKTTLLLALAGKLDSNLKVSGKVTYNGHEMNEFVPQRTAAYISQHDLHMGELTVRETLAFSARCQGVGDRHDMLVELSKREKEAKIKPDPDLDIMMKAAALKGQKENLVTDYIMKILGLDICADTQIGNEMLRGISGGQRKRVTTGEMMVGPSKVFLMDEISNGLDSSTTFQITNSIKQCIHILQGTAVISLLQPAPETYDLFDDIILLSDGKIVYQGPREHVLEFFEHMGFKCPARKGVADFLQEITSKKDQQQYWADSSVSYEFVSSKKFAEAFQSFHVGQKLSEELAVPFDKSNGHPASLTTKKYGVSKIELLKACISREFLLMKRNFFLYIFRMTYLIVMAVIIMTLFLRTTMHKDTPVDAHIFMGALFASVLTVMFNGFSELSLIIAKLPVFYKQRDLLFFPAWAYALPTWILKVPITFTESSLWVLITYYVIGCDSNAGRFFKQCLLFICITQTASGLFRLMGALGRDMIVANTFGSFALLAITVMSGFVLSRDTIKNWLVWGYWLSPMMYAHNAISVNEFLGDNWKKIPQGMTETIGEFVLKSHGLFTNANFYWIGVGALVGFTFLYNFLYVLALIYLNPLEKSQAILSDKYLEERNSCNNNELTEVSSRGKNLSKRINEVHGSVSLRFLLSQEGCIDKEEAKRKGMILPFEPLSLTFENIKYSVDMPQEMKVQGITEGRLELLKGINGSFRPGVLTALMGVSGAGKTTLMDVLAGRKTGGYIEGTITISGFPKKQQTFARIAGYCEQNDIHSPHVTVYESLKYSAWLRLPPEVDASTRKMFVKEVMELVELMPLKDALVGLPGVNGLSTEQRKRLTIAVELVANPSIIFMDEPTSGLDARAAAIVMRTVKNTVDTGRTVVCTIHQPSVDIFDSFNELVLLKRGGEEIYVGPIGHHASKLIKYFEGIAGVNRIKDGYNPATWMLEVTTTAQESALGVDFAELYKASELHRRNKALIKELGTPAAGSKDLYFPTQYSQPFFAQFIACLWKQNLSYWRNTQYTAVKFLFTVVIAFMIGAMFWNLGTRRIMQQDLLNAMGSMHAAVLFLGFQNSGSVQPVIVTERTVFYRERASGMYSALPYALALIAIELPYVLVQTILYGIIVYAMIGFQWTALKLFWYLFFMYFTLLYFTAYGMMSAAATPNQHLAGIASSACYGLWNIFSGFIVPQSRIPIWWKWYYYISPVAWSLYGLVASQFGDIEEEMIDTNMRVNQFIRVYFGFRHDFLGYVAIIHVGIAAVFTFTFAVSIKVLNFQKR